MELIGRVFADIEWRQVLLGLPFATGVLLSLPASAAAVHFMITAADRRRTLRDRMERLLLSALLPVVPLAALGYAKPGWHGHLGVRVAEVVFGIALLATIATFVWGMRPRRDDDAAPAPAPAGPVWPTRSAVSETLHGSSLLALGLFTAVAFVAHGMGWIAFEMR